MPYFMPCPVKCALCGAQGPTFSDKDYHNDFEELAREAWNMRTPTD